MKTLGLILLIGALSAPALAAKRTKKAPVVGRKSKVSQRTSRTKGLQMRKKRRVAIGTTVGGALGFLGANLELNLNEKTGIVGGYGGGPGYQSYTFEFKQYIAGDSFLPFLGAGYARWFNDKPRGTKLLETSPGFLAEKFLNDEEKETGVFGKNFVYMTIGAQYVNLSGDWAGFSLLAEVMLMVEVSGLTAAPNAAVGLMYYF